MVALAAMLAAAESGWQSALMVPTEILGRQHLKGMQKLLEGSGVKVALLSGKLKPAEKKAVQAQVASGEVQIVIGTHALFQESVSFHALGLVVIDEQHRFGVKQRLALSSKGQAPHLLLMSATPIPRSLTMIAYGDMDCSNLREKPANRLPIETRAVPLSRLSEVADGLGRALRDGARVYWICPLVEESEEGKRDLANAEERYRTFCSLFGQQRVALAHGKQKQEDRQEAMQRFASGEAQLLVATTVVEVGVDVPEATIMVIEHAERFGLAQLHQLRGRVGRGDQASHCILLYTDGLSENGKARLSILRESNDGFRIAEEDMRLRGSGDVLGTKQSGLPAFRFVDFTLHQELIAMAQDEMKLILHRDPQLATPRGQALKVLLYLFGRDESLRWLRAG
jgi:ATP-dependent DNA helicase RecG